MGLKEAIQDYREPTTRMVVIRKNPPDHSEDNGLLFSSTYMMLLSPEERLDEIAWYAGLVKSCEAAGNQGLYYRYPGFVDYNAHDDHIGVACASAILGLPFSDQISDYGWKHLGLYNTKEPGKWYVSAWFWRFPGLEPFFRAAADQFVGPMGQLLMCIPFLWNSRETPTETSGKCLLYLQGRTLYGKHWLVDRAIDYWRKKMMAMHPGGIRDVYKMYFRDGHPFGEYGPENFG